MKKFAIAAALSVSLCSMGALADTLTGYVSDAHCGAKHNADAPDAKCVNGCIKGGADPVFVADGKVYKFDDASKAKAKDLAGQKVTVDGSVSGDTVTVNSITAAQ